MTIKMTLVLFVVLAISMLVGCVQVEANSFPLYQDYNGQPITVTYNNRSILLNGEHVLFLSGSVHYPRFTPALWPQILSQARSDGLNMVEVYTFWNAHEKVEGVWDFSGKNNLLQFLDEAKKANLFVNLRIGPYVCAEWTSGGLPTWLAYKPGLLFRNYNQPWMDAMQAYVTRIVSMTRGYFAMNGGPIVLAQIENELSTSASPEYVQWCGDLAASFNAGVPWIMCNGASANNTINSCNGNDCSGFIEQHGQSGRILIDQPALLTENEQWFASWGDDSNETVIQGFNRSPEDVAFSVARWFARGGCHQNYYMWSGGNNYGSTASSSVPVAYADGASLHADGLPHEPKKTHLQYLHFTIANYASEIANNPAQANKGIIVPYFNNQTGKYENGTQQQVFLYGKLAFLESSAPVYVNALYNGVVYDMPPNSLLILYNDEIVYSTADVKYVPGYRAYTTVASNFKFSAWKEPITVGASISSPPIITSTRPLEQLQITLDLTDYMFYQTKFSVSSAGEVPLVIDSTSCNAFSIYIDEQYVSSVYDTTYYWSSENVTFKTTVPVTPGTHTLTLLSTSLGIEKGYNPNSGIHDHVKGITGSVNIDGVDITSGAWEQQPFLIGQWLGISQPDNLGAVMWDPDYTKYVNQSTTWYTTNFTITTIPPNGIYSVLLDTNGLGRGHAYVNGFDIGHYWLITSSAGTPTQRYYQIPPDCLQPTGEVNTLTIVEDLGAPHIDSIQIVYSFIDGTQEHQVADL